MEWTTLTDPVACCGPRGGTGQFLLVDPWSGNYFDLEAAKFMEPIGIEHFFDAFSLDKKRPLKVDAASALSSGSTPSTERCLTQLPGIDLASLWS